jgi:tetratricopeptide (TPR) repeat protein
MGSKQTMVIAPLVVMAWDWIFLGGLRRWRLYAGLASTWLLLAALVAYERWPTSIGFDLQGWTPWTYLLTQTTVIAHYVRLSVMGGPLALDYDGWPMATSMVAVLPYAIPLAALFVVTLRGLIRQRPWAFPAIVWFLALAPSSSILPLATEIAAERRMYVPLAAFVVLATMAVFEAGRRLVSNPRAARALAATGVFAVALIYGSLTYARNQQFWSTEAIWQDAVEKRPDNSRARLNYGVSLSLAGRRGDAEGQLREAIRLKETNAAAHLNLGAILASRGRVEEGISHLERTVALDSSYAEAYRNLGEAYGSLGDHLNAVRNFTIASSRNPDDVMLLNRVAWLLATSPDDRARDGARAVDVAERAVKLTGRKDPTSLDTLAAAYAETGRFSEAVSAARDAVEAAVSNGRMDMVTGLQTRLLGYRANQKYRER